MPKFRNISGHEVIKILCNKFEFQISGKSGSHVRLSKQTSEGKIGTVVPEHQQLKIGTLKGALRLAKISIEEFEKYI